MKLLIGGILATLVVAGCSAEPKPSPAGQIGLPGSERTRDMCAVLPGPEAAKALGVPSTKTKTDLDGACKYSELPGCDQADPDACDIVLEYLAGGWKEPDPPTGLTDVAGVGDKAYYSDLGLLMVKVGTARVRVMVGRDVAGGDAAKQKKHCLDLAKAAVAKL